MNLQINKKNFKLKLKTDTYNINITKQKTKEELLIIKCEINNEQDSTILTFNNFIELYNYIKIIK
jgi:hypothetical protein